MFEFVRKRVWRIRSRRCGDGAEPHPAAEVAEKLTLQLTEIDGAVGAVIDGNLTAVVLELDVLNLHLQAVFFDALLAETDRGGLLLAERDKGVLVFLGC